jgi:hypothetical protein
MKVYYAHCLAIYNTPVEERDIATLEAMGYEVLNPNQEKHETGYQKFKEDFPCYPPMRYWNDLVDKCDALAFRALPDGSIPKGVATEIKRAKVNHKPVFELPSRIERRTLTLEETREYLRDIGQR